MKISGITITPVAFADPPLLTAAGVHEPFAIRAVVEVATDDGLTGLGETYADARHFDALEAAARSVEGTDVYHTEEIYRRVAAVAVADGPVIASGPALRRQVVLSDHHYWGGLRRSRLLAGICDTFGLGLSMHSNSHLGISLAAMVHLAAATPNLS
jgi:L-alanine-DL-glutamate epimerase-like enolase superfamily enzyme